MKRIKSAVESASAYRTVNENNQDLKKSEHGCTALRANSVTGRPPLL